MIKRLREKENSTKQEGDTSNEDKFSTSSRLWLGLKDTRIVRVPRAFGGKDRHCKVSTIRGLRDRRVRLSVQTAIQLYDLQDKLGVNQPSKVVDWLLNAAQHEIDKLPPLPFPPESFTHFCQSSPVSGDANPRAFPYHPTALENLAYTTQRNVKRTDELGDCHLALFSSKTNDEVLGNKVSELAKFPSFTLSSSIRRDAIEEGNSIRAIEAENDNVGSYCAQVSANVPLPRYNDSSLTGLGSNVIPCASSYHLEPANSNTYEHQLEGHSSKVEVPSFSVPSSLSLASGSQLVFYASGGMPSMFSPYMTNLNSLNSTQLNHFQTSASQNLQSSSVTFLQSGSPVMVRPSQPRLPSNHHNPYNHHGN